MRYILLRTIWSYLCMYALCKYAPCARHLLYIHHGEFFPEWVAFHTKMVTNPKFGYLYRWHIFWGLGTYQACQPIPSCNFTMMCQFWSIDSLGFDKIGRDWPGWLIFVDSRNPSLEFDYLLPWRVCVRYVPYAKSYVKAEAFFLLAFLPYYK